MRHELGYGELLDVEHEGTRATVTCSACNREIAEDEMQAAHWGTGRLG